MTFGNKLYNAVNNGKNLLFTQGEMANLTYISFDKFIEFIQSNGEEIIPITHPVGFGPDNTPINSTTNYTKEELIGRYQHLGLNKLPIDGIFQLVTITETILNFILREILIEFPAKIPSKRKLDVDIALNANSLEEIKISIVESVLNEISYKSPKDYAEEFERFTGVNLKDFPFFHKYIELKATRDIHIHNGGTANEIYLAKAGILARVKNSEYLPVDVQYFLQSFECCIQITEFLEIELDKIWPSEDYRAYKEKQKNKSLEKLKSEAVDEAIKEIKKHGE